VIFGGNDGEVSRQPAVPYLAVATALRERLDSGEWLPGEQIPSATAIAAQYGVSRTTAARAVRVLADEARVTVVRNWGAFVADK
jgi:DNA-binding GntR family transcriptional regulator